MKSSLSLKNVKAKVHMFALKKAEAVREHDGKETHTHIYIYVPFDFLFFAFEGLVFFSLRETNLVFCLNWGMYKRLIILNSLCFYLTVEVNIAYFSKHAHINRQAGIHTHTHIFFPHSVCITCFLIGE